MLISPAKSLNYEKEIQIAEHSVPCFLNEAQKLNDLLKNKSPKNNNNKMVARQNSKLECHPSQESIWLMNQCHHGYVAVLPDRRVVSLDANEPNNKLGKKRKKYISFYSEFVFLQEKS